MLFNPALVAEIQAATGGLAPIDGGHHRGDHRAHRRVGRDRRLPQGPPRLEPRRDLRRRPSVVGREPRAEQRREVRSGVAASSACEQRPRAGQTLAMVGDVPAERRPEQRRAHPRASRRRAGCRPGCRRSRSSRRCRSGRSTGRAGRSAPARPRSPVSVARDEVGHRLVRERLARLVVADQPVEPLVRDLVGDEVAQVRAADARTGSRPCPAPSIP